MTPEQLRDYDTPGVYRGAERRKWRGIEFDESPQSVSLTQWNAMSRDQQDALIKAGGYIVNDWQCHTSDWPRFQPTSVEDPDPPKYRVGHLWLVALLAGASGYVASWFGPGP